MLLIQSAVIFGWRTARGAEYHINGSPRLRWEAREKRLEPESREGDIYVSVPKAFRPYLSNPPAGRRKCPSSLEAETPLIGDPD